MSTPLDEKTTKELANRTAKETMLIQMSEECEEGLSRFAWTDLTTGRCTFFKGDQWKPVEHKPKFPDLAGDA